MKTKRINVILPLPLLEQIDTQAKLSGMSRTTYLITILNSYTDSKKYLDQLGDMMELLKIEKEKKKD